LNPQLINKVSERKIRLVIKAHYFSYITSPLKICDNNKSPSYM